MALVSTFTAVCAELDRRRRITMGLERVERLLSLLGDPHGKMRIVQVVGTNGKGTTAVALTAALTELGQPAGAYLSPHVLAYNERVMIGGGFVSEATFARAMQEAIEVADRHDVPASQFELLTAGAVKLLADEGVKWAVLEAGLGARHDATSAVAPEAVVLTNVGLDHAEYLGGTVEEVSREKLASVSSGSVLILGTANPIVLEEAGKRCAEVGARLIRAGGDGYSRGNAPPYVLRNAALGIRAAEELTDAKLDDEGREKVKRDVVGTLPGRFEAFEVDGVPVVVDGAHNVSGVEATLGAVEAAYGERPLAVVFGVLRGKDARSMLTALSAAAEIVVLTRPEGDRAAEPEDLLGEFRGMEADGAMVEQDPVKAVQTAVLNVRDDGIVLVVGSFQTAAPVMRWLRE